MTQVFTVGGTDYTDVLDKLSPEIGGKAAYGERSVGKATLYDDENVIDDDGAVKVWKKYTWVETATTPDTTLSAGRVTGWATRRGESGEDSIMDNEVQWDLQLEDANAELQKLACAPDIGPCDSKGQYVRPAETDVERVLAVAADWLNGDPRASTVIDTSAYVPDANTVDMDAKTYPPGTTPADILMECLTAADKDCYVDQDYNLHYDIPTTELYDADLEISDGVGAHPAVDDDTYFAPIWDMGPALDWQGQEFVTALVGVYGANQAVYEEDASNTAAYDYLLDAVNVDAETSGQAAHDIHGLLRVRGRGMRTYQLTLRLKNTQVDKIKWGHRVRLHVSAAVDMDDTPQWRRVAELKWQPVGDGSWYDAHLTLERMPRIFPGNINGGPIVPKPPDTGTPGTPPTSPTTDLYWTFTDRGGVQSDNLLDDGTSTYYWATGGWDTNGNPGGRLWWGASGARLTPAFSVTPGVVYTFEADVKQAQTTANAYLRVEWYNSVNTQLQIDYIAGPGVGTGWATYTKVVTAPTGADHIFLRADSHTGTQAGADNIYIKHGGSGGTAGTPSTSGPTTVGGTGEGTYSDSGEYVPVGSVLEHSYITEGGPYHDADQIAIDDVGDYYTGTDVEAALQELGAAGGASSSSGPHSHPDLAEADFTITAAPEGGWGRITKNNLAYLNGYTYISYITGDDGDARVAVVADTDPSTVVNTVTLHVALAVDDHSAAVIAIDPSTHKLMTVYTTHGDTTVRTRVSTTSLDTDPDLGDGFASEQSLDAALGSSTYTYPNILYLADESKWYLFVRAGGSGSSADWYYSTSSDFSTWAAATKFFDEATRWVYLKPVVNGAARIDFIANDGSPANDTDVSTVAFYYEGGSWFDLDGNDLGTLPLSGADATLIADGATAETSIVDVAVLPDGNPAYLYADIEDTAHHFIHHVRWTGSALVDTTLVDSGAAIEATGTFSGHANMDPSDPMRVWVSVENGSGFYDLWQYSIEDDAPTGRRIAEGLTGADNLRPAGIPGHGDALHVVWLVGSYTDINTFDFGISGAGVTASAAGTDEKAKVSSNDTTAGYLNGKLVAGTNITLTENNDGSNETLTIAASGSGSDTAWIVDPGSPSYSGTGPVTVALTSVFGIDGSGNPYYNAAGVTDGEEAALVWDSTTGSYSLRPYYP